MQAIRHTAAEAIRKLNTRLILADVALTFIPSFTLARLRTQIYRMAGLKIGRNTLILGRLRFTGSGGPVQERLKIGADTVINKHFFADLDADVCIGNGVAIGHHVMCITADHEIGPRSRRAGPLRPSAIVIGDGCWIGARSTILPGVTIGNSSIVAAGSVVSMNVPANRVVGGAPARPLKTLPDEP